ncbi:regulatory LuxR family protein [Streptomyces sp. 840.1]|uniref:LuxR C-terminal-related transcriptional regulator n=1 Tax=Streptomyces sp. 840.1 TaxID=2485152 RepID=UPI000FC14CDF|nr:LuxR C-terminal-related transcriptional regulator [Streptomyces sp. 840.1]ROQ70253.1 regulatory LuxR family protein [Streptomyces sp. 840.1]
MIRTHTRRILLTNRQEDTLQALADGYRREEVALRLGISPKSLNAMLCRARTRLGTPPCADTRLIAVACMSDAIWVSPPPDLPVRVPKNLRYLIAPLSDGMQAVEIANERRLPYSRLIADCHKLRQLMEARTSAHLVARLWQHELAPMASQTQTDSTLPRSRTAVPQLQSKK